MPGQDGDAVEKSVSNGIWSRKGEAHGEVVELFYRNRFSGDRQQVALGRPYLFIEVNLAGEHYIVGIKGDTVREAEPLAQLQRELLSISGCSP